MAYKQFIKSYSGDESNDFWKELNKIEDDGLHSLSVDLRNLEENY